jgi:hypothetical protein
MADEGSGLLSQLHEQLNEKGPEFIEARAEFEYGRKVFISHTVADSAWCEQHILAFMRSAFVPEHLYKEESYFFLNRASAEYLKDTYYVFVEFALRYAKSIVIVVSRNAIGSQWVRFETHRALEQKQPLIVCLTDGTDPRLLRNEFSEASRPEIPVAYVDFTRNPPDPDALLQSLLRSPLYQPEFRNIPIGIGYADAFSEFSKKRHSRKRPSFLSRLFCVVQ